MAKRRKEYKIKRRKNARTIKARPHPLFVILIALLVVGLGYLGFISYQPIYNAVMNRGKDKPEPPPVEVSQPEGDPEAPDVITQPEPEPPPQTVTGLKGVYLPNSLVMNPAQLNAFLDGLADTSINAVMVDIKDKSGKVLFSTKHPEAREWDAIASGAFDLSSLNQLLSDRGLSLIVRMSAFRDETAARGNTDYAVCYRAPGTTWLDNFPEMGGKPWLNPYSQGARDYLTQLALEAVDCGAALVVLEDYHFPPNSLTGDAYFGDTGGASRNQALADFARQLEEAVSAKGARSAIYITTVALAAEPNLTTYGGDAADIPADTVMLGALPYQFFDGYSTDLLTISKPLSDPGATVKQAVTFAQGQLGERQIIPLIQGGNEPHLEIVYNAGQIAGQIKALEGLGIEEYLLYCTSPDAYLLEG